MPTGNWFDPPTASGYSYQMTEGSLFTQILDLPSGFNQPFTVSANGEVLGTFGPGQSVDFTKLPGGGVSDFTITGIDPGTDPNDPQAFPIKLAFNTPTASFTMQAVVPEPSTLLLATLGAAGLAFCGWRKRGQARPTISPH
ncbi:MAG: PEP-CTERM sorting domain-containing protein [Pirellulales bacterium]|nr:PEP-CTERM sorting domain-containing protein [Pirellulales bacterium]